MATVKYADMTPAQRRLYDRMCDISSNAFMAGWLIGLEYRLWSFVLGEREMDDYAGYEREEMGPELLALAVKAGGWCTYDGFVEFSDWLSEFELYRQGYWGIPGSSPGLRK